MTKAIYEDLEPVSDLIIKCPDCGTPFVEESTMKNHRSMHRVSTVEVGGIAHRVATDF